MTLPAESQKTQAEISRAEIETSKAEARAIKAASQLERDAYEDEMYERRKANEILEFNNKKEQLQDDSFLYKFVQLSNDVIKRNNESTILSAEQLDVKSIIENVSGDKMDMFSRKEPSGSEFSER